MKRTLPLLLSVAAIALPALAAPAHAGTNEMTAQIGPMAAQVLDGYRYDRTRRCTGGPQRGARALSDWLVANVPGVSWGIYNCRRVRGGSSLSLHAEGRAVDWHLDVKRPAERKAAYGLVAALLAPDPRAARTRSRGGWAFRRSSTTARSGRPARQPWDAPLRWLPPGCFPDERAPRSPAHRPQLARGAQAVEFLAAPGALKMYLISINGAPAR